MASATSIEAVPRRPPPRPGAERRKASRRKGSVQLKTTTVRPTACCAPVRVKSGVSRLGASLDGRASRRAWDFFSGHVLAISNRREAVSSVPKPPSRPLSKTSRSARSLCKPAHLLMLSGFYLPGSTPGTSTIITPSYDPFSILWLSLCPEP